MNIDWAAMVNKVPEIAIIVAIIYFTLKMMEMKNASTTAIVAQNMASVTKITEDNMTSISKITTEFSATIERVMQRNSEQNKLTMNEWREFMGAQREEDRRTITNFGNKVSELAAVIHETHPRTKELPTGRNNPKTRPLP